MSSDKGKNSNNALANLPIINRLKSIKDLFVKKLDQTYSKTSQINKTSVQINKAVNVLLQNDSSLLEASINLVEALQLTRREIEQQNQQIEQQNQQIEQQNQQFLEALQTTQSDVNKILKLSENRLVRDESAGDLETRLMAYLYSYLPNRCALDIGANVGNTSEKLLQAGYKVYAFEPLYTLFEQLNNRFDGNSNFHCYPLAIGSENKMMDLYIVSDQSETDYYKDTTLLNSLTRHSLPDGLVFKDSVLVTVKTLESLHESSEIPANIDLVKIDTEGFDLEVIKGMGSYAYPIVVAEFWDEKFPFGNLDARNRLEDMVKIMKEKKYYWYLVIYRLWCSDEVAFYCNYPRSIENSWGNVFFFQDYQVFNQALMWCSSVMPATYFA